MANIRLEKRDLPYVQIDKTGINDPNLSPESLGVLAYILSKPNNWQAHKREILKRFQGSLSIKTTQNKIDSVFIELRKAGYVKIAYIKDDKTGQIKGSEFIFREIPELPTSPTLGKESEYLKCSDLGKKPNVGNVPQLKDNDFINNNDFNKIKNESEKEILQISALTPDPDDQTDITVNNLPKLESVETKETEIKNTEGAKFSIIDSEEKLKAKMIELFQDEFFLNYFIDNYSIKGFKQKNINSYCQNFSLQFFKDKTLCSLSDSELKKKLAAWSYIFAKENEDIEKAKRIEDRAKGNYPNKQSEAKSEQPNQSDEQVRQIAQFKAIQADLIEKIKKGELTEKKALQIAAEKKKELGIQ